MSALALQYTKAMTPPVLFLDGHSAAQGPFFWQGRRLVTNKILAGMILASHASSRRALCLSTRINVVAVLDEIFTIFSNVGLANLISFHNFVRPKTTKTSQIWSSFNSILSSSCNTSSFSRVSSSSLMSSVLASEMR